MILQVEDLDLCEQSRSQNTFKVLSVYKPSRPVSVQVRLKSVYDNNNLTVLNWLLLQHIPLCHDAYIDCVIYMYNFSSYDTKGCSFQIES